MDNMTKYLILCEDLAYFAARDIGLPTKYNRACLKNTLALKDDVYKLLTPEQKNDLIRGKGRFKVHARDFNYNG